MRKASYFLLLLLVAAPAFAQSGQQFGILLGGAKRLYTSNDRSKVDGLSSDRFRFTSGVREVFYAVEIEPTTLFKIQAGQWSTDVGEVEAADLEKGTPAKVPRRGTIQHANGIIDYRFSEPFGTTGLFAGVGIYRWSAPTASGSETVIPTETNYGFEAGVNGEFPMTRRTAIMVEGAYHWVNMTGPVRYITLTGGLRFGF